MCQLPQHQEIRNHLSDCRELHRCSIRDVSIHVTNIRIHPMKISKQIWSSSEICSDCDWLSSCFGVNGQTTVRKLEMMSVSQEQDGSSPGICAKKLHKMQISTKFVKSTFSMDLKIFYIPPKKKKQPFNSSSVFNITVYRKESSGFESCQEFGFIKSEITLV